ncbi:MAG: diguanylate cyclase [Desulfuromonadaceae bacterium]|nr:diguanylate cyclase [Desulfuromonadaceae bacterium]
MKAKCLSTLLVFLFLSASPLWAGLEPVSLQLQWLHQFQFAGYYVAQEQGFYQAAGLEVTLREYRPNLDVVEEVLAHRAQFGTGKSSLALNRLQGDAVILLGAIFQQAPEILIATRPDIRAPQDLAGKRVMMTPDQSTATCLLSMLISQGVSLDNLQVQPHSSNLADLIEGRTDAMACYLSNEPYQLEQAGIPYQIFNPADYGFSSYGDLLFTSEEQIRNHPQQTRAFYEASLKGWQWAFDHIEETAQLILHRYHPAGKTLAGLIFEGQVLKKMAFSHHARLGTIHRKKIDRMMELYRLSGLVRGNHLSLEGAIDPLGFNRQEIEIGVLAVRDTEKARQRWVSLANYLNAELDEVHCTIIPGSYEQLTRLIDENTIDFLLVNPVLYLAYENQYGLSRIATLLNRGWNGKQAIDRYGSVLFTTAQNPVELTPEALAGQRLAAVDPRSLGGWLIALETLQENGIRLRDMKVSFLGSQDAVVQAVLQGTADIGVVRTGIIEQLEAEDSLDGNALHIVHEQQQPDFPYRVSTKLYPEWSFAKLKHVPVETANLLASALLGLTGHLEDKETEDLDGWTVPIDYSEVHRLLKKQHLPPYDQVNYTLSEFVERYALWVYSGLTLLTILLLHGLYSNRLNKHLADEVRKHTKQLRSANKNLQQQARTDALTGLHNRRYFMEFAQQYISLAQRNETPLQLLSLDIDHFKQVNDQFGHQVGDEILIRFARTLEPLLRSSDLMARIGGEEFVVCLQNTTPEGAVVFAEKVLAAIRAMTYYTREGATVTITVSIGIAALRPGQDLSALLRRSDRALYRAKDGGRDQFVQDESDGNPATAL